jgi:hypothetical protein
MNATNHPCATMRVAPGSHALPVGKPKQPTHIPFNKFAAIDFETADYGRDSVCAVAVVVAHEGKIVNWRGACGLCIRPGCRMSAAILGFRSSTTTPRPMRWRAPASSSRRRIKEHTPERSRAQWGQPSK